LGNGGRQRVFFRSRFWKNYDWVLQGVVLLLVAIGLLVIWSTTIKATSVAGQSDVMHQGVFVVLGLVGGFFAARIDYRTWFKLTPWLYGAMVLSLVAVLVLSRAVLGAQRWISLGFFQFQPSEFAKLVVIVVLAKFFAQNYDKLEQPKYLALSLAYVAVPVALVMKQPDLGTALVLVVIWMAMALVSRVRKLHLAILAGVALIMLPFGLKLLKPFQRARLETFINPTADPLHTGYNAVQSTITVGSGQIFGRGLAAGSQSQLNFLPPLAQHTDFIFAVLGEKMGFVGALLLLFLFGVLFYRGVGIAYRAQDRFGMFLATGIVAMLLFHVFINVGMNMGIAPVTGIPLPFVSYGGTALIVGMLAVGLLESVAVRRKKLQFEG
jgi:rod shape determining protein RodA